MPELPVSLRRYLEISQQPAGSAFHTSQISISFGEAIDVNKLRSAWEAVSRAHAALRTTFATDDTTLAVSEAPLFDWEILNWNANPPADVTAAWQSLVQSDASTPIANETFPPCRFTFIHLPDGTGHVLWSFHGALLDYDSISTVIHRWLQTYDSLCTGDDIPSFADSFEKAPIEDSDWKAAYKNFKAPRPLIVLPLPETGIVLGTRRSIIHNFERSEGTNFAASAAAIGADLRSLFSSVWAFVIARATTSDDALVLENFCSENGVGRHETFVMQRRRVEIHATSGDLVRACHTEFRASPTDPSFLSKALNLTLADLNPATSFIYRACTLNDRIQLEMPRWMAVDIQLMQHMPPSITLQVIACDRPKITLDYDPAILSDPAAHLLFDLFLRTLIAFTKDASLQLSKFALPGKPTVAQGAETPAVFRSLVPQNLHELFADVVAESPEAIAIEMGSQRMTFAQLNNSANQLAQYLRKNRVEVGARVGIFMPHSPRWVMALLGVLKASASIVPLSETSASSTANIKALLVDTLPEGETHPIPVIRLQSDSGVISGEKSRGLSNESAPTSEALSWQNGNATFTHESLTAALQSTAALLGVTSADRVLQFSPTDSFFAVEETLMTLLSGATLILREDSRWTTRTAVQEFVQESKVTTLSIPTPFWTQWIHYLNELSLQAPETLRMVAIHGDLPSSNAISAWYVAAGKTQLLHRIPIASCGLSLAGMPTAVDPSFIGSPGPGVVARLMDSRGLPLPAGLPGWAEIGRREKDYASVGIETFVTSEGNFHARNILQAMVSGPSSDVLAESIRLAATTHPEIIDAYVDQRLIATRQEWCLWIVPRDSQRGEPYDFRNWLAERLPSPPQRIRALPRLPLTEAGYIDPAALADQLPEDSFVLPEQKGTEDEEQLRQIVSRVLGGRRIELDEVISEGRIKPQMAKLLHEAVKREEPLIELSDFTTSFSIRSLLRNVRARKSSKDSKWIPIQPLRASGKQPPLIFIHDLDGTAKPYTSLIAHLEADQPCYAMTARGSTDPSACHVSVTEMADAYLKALQTFDANGPYRLIGYGFGGIVAFEMASQLAHAGEDVSLLVLLATEPPKSNSTTNFLVKSWKHSLSTLLGKKRTEAINKSPVFSANQEAALTYSAARTSLIAHVFTPTINFLSSHSVQKGWEACCDQVVLYQVPCSPSAMMEEPAVESLAQALSKLAQGGDLYDELEA